MANLSSHKNNFSLLAVAIIYISLTFQARAVEGARILAIFPFAGPSQYICVLPYLKTLAARGHEMHVVNAFPQKEKIENFHDIPLLESQPEWDEIYVANNNNSSGSSMWLEMNIFVDICSKTTEMVLKNDKIQRFIKSRAHFDLIIVEILYSDALYGLSHYFGVPLIGVSTFGTSTTIDEFTGNASPVSYIPSISLGKTDSMSFLERLHNLAVISVELLHWHTVHLPLHEKLYSKYFPHAKVGLYEVRKNFSLILLNQHFSLSFPRPYVPQMIEVGGFHINHKPTEIPPDMEAFINGSKNGVIYFSLGSNIKSKDLPKEKLQILLDTFAQLDQSVMWKFEEPNLPGKPSNVFISKWFPQPDILAHPKVKLFITHGGLLSTIEAIHNSKPIVGIPMIFDQFLNVARVCKAGFGLSVDFRTLSSADLTLKIKQVLENPSFTQKVSKISQLYHDQPMKPMDKAIYWTEYVLRHKGTPHMRVSAQNLNFIQYHSIDTIAVLYGGLLLAALTVVYVFIKILRRVFAKQNIVKKAKRH